jgi:hypothetical protein
MSFIKTTREKLKNVESQVEKASAPALSPQQRRVIAMQMSGELDELHRSNPVLEFIGQSQMTLNAAVISGTRYLEDVFAVAEWKRVHEEIVAGHHAALDFMENWLTYAAAAVENTNARWDDGYSLDPLPFLRAGDVGDLSPYEHDLMVAEALELIRKLSDADTSKEALDAHVLLDNLIARADHKWWYFWDDRIDWKLALAMEQEGRNAEAGVFMRRMENKSMGVFGLPHDGGVAFLKDAARIISSNDMCYMPNFDNARLYVQNALDLEPGDEEGERILRDINAKALRYYIDVLAVAKVPGKDTPQSVSGEWYVDRARAEQAISDRNLEEAFDIVWSMVKKFILVIPQGASDYLEWLTDHIDRVESGGLRFKNVPGIRREIYKWMPLFKELGTKVSPNFGHIAEETATETEQPLAEQGIKV